MPGLEDLVNRSAFNKGAGKKQKKVTFGKGAFKNIEQAYKQNSSSNNRPNVNWEDDSDVEFDED